MADELATIHIDGASRGNPGEAAYAVVIGLPQRAPIEVSGTLGKQTNNVAEYTALVKALERAAALSLKRLHIHSDSELLVKQINGEYRVKNEELKGFYDEAKQLMRGFASVKVTHIRREENKRADELCNLVLDGEKKTAAPKPNTKPAKTGQPKGTVGDGRVREDCLECLRSAKACWARGEPVPSAELVWDQLWSILEGGGVLKPK